MRISVRVQELPLNTEHRLILEVISSALISQTIRRNAIKSIAAM